MVSPIGTPSKDHEINKMYDFQTEEKKVEKMPILESYIGISTVRQRRSISESRLEEDEFEEITDGNYILSEAEWVSLLGKGWYVKGLEFEIFIF